MVFQHTLSTNLFSPSAHLHQLENGNASKGFVLSAFLLGTTVAIAHAMSDYNN